jgi:hypothetical protein
VVIQVTKGEEVSVESGEPQEQPELQVLLELQVQLDPQEHQEQLGQVELDRQVLQVPQEQQEPQAELVQQA